jgi:hypothetical protein
MAPPVVAGGNQILAASTVGVVDIGLGTVQMVEGVGASVVVIMVTWLVTAEEEEEAANLTEAPGAPIGVTDITPTARSLVLVPDPGLDHHQRRTAGHLPGLALAPPQRARAGAGASLWRSVAGAGLSKRRALRRTIKMDTTAQRALLLPLKHPPSTSWLDVSSGGARVRCLVWRSIGLLGG